ncbi:hypothetical protein [Pseudomonas gozinkensis]|uniref:hypothetical protein n=1 Tax=Pseudomonas gozinkensis TaxID=2774461 RepID=UPI001787F487|nr:hypothetical protein [Pseudomonas gozinkensis]
MNPDNDVDKDKETFDESSHALRATGEIEGASSGGERAVEGSVVALEQTESGTLVEVIITARSDDHPLYIARLRVSGSYTQDGRSFTCNATEYLASDNGRDSGNVYLSTARVGKPWHPDELTNDDAKQNGQWHPIRGQSTVVADSQPVVIGFRFMYDRAGTGDVLLSGHEIVHYVPYVPPVPRINPIRNVAGSPYEVAGTGGVSGGQIIIVVANTDTTIGVADGSSGTWQTQLSFPVNVNTTSIQAFQRVNGRDSDRTAAMQIYRAALTSPQANATVPAKGLIFHGIGAPGSTVLVVKSPPNHGVVLSEPTDIDDQGSWQAPLIESLPSGPVSVSALVAYAGTNSLYTLPVAFYVVSAPVITRPDLNSLQNSEFQVGGSGGVAGATMQVLHDFDHNLVVGEAKVTGDSWDVNVQVKPGRRSLVARQTDKNIPSDVSAPRSFDIRPPQLTKVEVTFLSAISINFAGPGFDGATVEINVVASPGPAPGPLTGPVRDGVWEIVALNWPFGHYVLQVIQMVSNNAGGWIESKNLEISVDYRFPAPHDIEATDDYQPTLSGRGVPNATVSLFDGDKVTPIAPDAPVGFNGQWSSKVHVEWGPTFERGVQIIQKLAGQTSDWVAYSVNIAPRKPVIYPVPTDGLSPVFSGTCWLNAVVELVFSDSGTTRFPAVVTGITWSYLRPDPFAADVPHTVTAIQIAAQQPSPEETVTFQLSRPMIAPVITDPPENTEVGRETDVGGTGGMSGATLHVYDFVHGHELGCTVLQADGLWSMRLKDLPFGPLVIRAMQEINGRKSEFSEQHRLKVGLLPPVITSPSEDGRLTRTAMMKGKGEPNAQVEVFPVGDSKALLSAKVDSNGVWEGEVTQEVGEKTIQARQYFEGQTSKDSPQVNYVVVPATPRFETPADGEAFGNNSYASGFAERAGDTVIVWIGGPGATRIAETTVQEDLTWSARISTTQPSRKYEPTATASSGSFVSDPTARRSAVLGTFEPDVDGPGEGQPVENPVAFNGRGRAGLMRVCSWFDPDLGLLTVPVSSGVWEGTATESLSPGGQWCVIQQSITDDAGGATISEAVTSQRFEVGSGPANNDPLEKPDKRSR